jgi:gliding motility-associated-like protein
MRYFISFTLLLLPILLFAQPANDDCATAASVNIGDCAIYNNVGATNNTGIVNFNPIGLSCNPTATEVWFEFTTPAAPTDLQLTITGMTDGTNPALVQPSVAFLIGNCPAMVFEASACQEAAAGSGIVQFNINGVALIPNFPYYIVISGWSATALDNEGAFELCLEEYVPPADICSGSPATITDCSGTIYDSGGDSGDYGPNENCVFTITPTIFSQCIVATVNSYDIENFGDVLNFYDGPSTASPQIQSVSGVGAGLVVQASSGSLTIEFISDGTVQESGFELSWQCTTDDCTILAPIDVDELATIDALVDALSSPLVIVENPILNCPDGAYGTYTSPGNTQLEVMGLPEGIVLSSGSVNDIENNEAFFASTINGVPGDPDLDVLSPIATQDACVFEFDVYAATSELEFNYVFGSEEYPNFVGGNFNDIFAFFISGPGLTPNTNIAVLGDGTTPVSINTVNDGIGGVGGPIDPTTGDVIYINNAGGLSLPYGGYTTVLTARADVVPCNYYHLKLAIADRGDSSYDSGVFIADLQAGLPQVNVEFAINNVDGDNILVEGCSGGSDVVTAVIENPNQDTFIYYINLTGTADVDLDLMDAIPDSLLAIPGTSTFIIPFVPVDDGLDEGVETLTLELFAIFDCDTVVYNSVPILIYDNPNVQTDQDTFFVCTGTSVILGVSGATDYTWTWPNPSEIDNPNLINPTLTPSVSGDIYVTGIISGNSNCISSDTAYIQIIDPTITAVTAPPFICENESVEIVVSTNTNNTGISWLPVDGLSCIDCPSPIATPSGTTTYVATVSAGGCSSTTSITVTVDPLPIPVIIAETEICEGSSIILAGAPSSAGATYLWTPNNSTLDDETSSTPTATPSVTTIYTVISTSANGACTNSQSVTINVAPATIDILGADTIYQCTDALEAVTLSTASITAPGDISWTDSNGGSYPNGGSLIVNTNEVITYYATVSFGTCTNSDSIVIQVDSLPAFMLEVSVPTQGIMVTNPDTVDVCAAANESFFVTNIYNSALYPEMEHEWLINGISYNPAQNGANLLDALPFATIPYVLTSDNNACSSTDTFVIDVNTPPNFAITPANTTICEGESVNLEATGASDFTWIPNDGSLSATDINNPVATPTQTTTYTAFSDIAGCQAGVSTTITVLGIPGITLNSGLVSCSNQPVTLANGPDNPNFTYTWSPNDFISGDGTSSPVAAPLVTTDYSVTVSNGLCEIVESVTVIVSNDLPVTITGNAEVCLGESATLFANTQGAVNWFDENNVLIETGATLVLTPSSVGTQVISAEAFSTFCSTMETITVTTTAAPSLSVSIDVSICAGEQAVLLATTNIGTLAWSPTNEFADPSLPSQTVSPNGTTTYTVTASNAGCVATEDVTINVSDAPIYGIVNDTTICQGNAIFLGVLDDPSTTYVWMSDGEAPSNATIGNPTASPDVVTTYTLTATNGGCVETAQVTVSVADPNISVTNATPVCSGFPATLTAVATPAGGTIIWTDWQGNEVGTGNTLVVIPFAATSYAASYSINGCNISDVGSVSLLPAPNTSTSATEVAIVAGGSSTITLTGAPVGSTFVWADLVGDVDLTETSNVVTVSPSVTTDFLVTITTPDGCTYEDRIRIEVIFQEMRLPNTFTPNNDGLNDKFAPVYSDLSVEVVEFKVFDRWGELVHDNVSEGWDGSLNGKNLPSDIYVYFVRLKYNDGTEELLKGDVALVR